MVHRQSGGRFNVGDVALPEIGTLRVGQNGTLSGTGEILGDVLIDGGTLSPGASPGVLSVSGSLTQLDGLLALEIGGPTPGLEHDQLVVGGDVTPAGIIQLTFVDGFSPAPGQSFDLIAPGASISDHRAVLDFEGLPDPLALSAVFVEGVLSFLDAPLTGDTNHDGVVGIVDLNNVRNNFGAAGNPVLGDTNLDGHVDIIDLNNVRNNFGAQGRPSQAVPEPCTALLAACALVPSTILAERHRRRGLHQKVDRSPTKR